MNRSEESSLPGITSVLVIRVPARPEPEGP